MPKTPTPTLPTTRLCPTCGHRLIAVILDTGMRLELDTQIHCYVISGREQEGLPVYVPSRSFVEHSQVCKNSLI